MSVQVGVNEEKLPTRQHGVLGHVRHMRQSAKQHEVTEVAARIVKISSGLEETSSTKFPA